MTRISKALAIVIVLAMSGLVFLGVNTMSDNSTENGALPTVSAIAGQAPTISAPNGTAPATLTT